uniref:hypothetical protein n=1 Tax=Ningiella ruwaisensis TaxID=2364274 RepID=UPI00109FD46D|nr:hypothetical protein [Ningiella ruwaisensis]
MKIRSYVFIITFCFVLATVLFIFRSFFINSQSDIYSDSFAHNLKHQRSQANLQAHSNKELEAHLKRLSTLKMQNALRFTSAQSQSQDTARLQNNPIKHEEYRTKVYDAIDEQTDAEVYAEKNAEANAEISAKILQWEGRFLHPDTIHH